MPLWVVVKDEQRKDGISQEMFAPKKEKAQLRIFSLLGTICVVKPWLDVDPEPETFDGRIEFRERKSSE